jgi:hypothetical protein
MHLLVYFYKIVLDIVVYVDKTNDNLLDKSATLPIGDLANIAPPTDIVWGVVGVVGVFPISLKQYNFIYKHLFQTLYV